MAVVTWHWSKLSEEVSYLDLIQACNTRFGRLDSAMDGVVAGIVGVRAGTLGSTVPSVANTKYVTLANTVPTTITGFADGRPGDERVLWATTANTTIAHSAAVGGIRLLDGVNITMGANEVRRFGTVDGVSWRELQGAVGVAASATKLATARTLWGQSFDGTANVSGALSGATTGAFSGIVSSAGLSETGDVLFTDALYDIGKTGATRPRDGFFSRNVVVGATLTAAALVGPLTGNADTATKLQTARTLAITGDLAWTSPAFDGSGNVTAAGTLATVNAGPGVVGSSTAIPVLTTNGKGLVTLQSTAVVIAPAGTLSGTTLNATVTASSLTSLGTLAADLLFTDALYDIGKTGATRPRDGFFSRNLTVGGAATVATGLTVSASGITSTGLSTLTGGTAMVLGANQSLGASRLIAQQETASIARFYTCGPDAATHSAFEFYTSTSAAIDARILSLSNGAAVVGGTLACQGLSASTGVFTGQITDPWNPVPARLTADNAAIAAAVPTTFVAVAGLTQAVGVNEEWDVEWVLHIANSVATDVFVVNVSPTAGTFTGRYTVIGQNGVPTAGAGVVKHLLNPTGTGTTATANAPGNTGTIGLVTTIIVRAQGKQTVSAGSLQVSLRAGTSAAASSGTATVKTQSQMIATRLA
jgi:hypothetical protein